MFRKKITPRLGLAWAKSVVQMKLFFMKTTYPVDEDKLGKFGIWINHANKSIKYF